MKGAAFLLLSCYAGLCLGSPEVEVQLRQFRTEMSPHGFSMNPALSVTLEFIAPEGFSLCESDELPGALSLTDASGKSRAFSPAALRPDAENGRRSALAEFNLASRPKGNEVTLSGSVSVTLASGQLLHPPQEVNLLEPGEWRWGDACFQAEPDKANSDKKNREGPMLRRAALLLRYPLQVNILRITRIWQARTPEADSSASGYAQEVSFTTSADAQGQGLASRLELWDARPVEILQLTTCKEQQQVSVPIHFTLRLGEVVESPPPHAP